MPLDNDLSHGVTAYQPSFSDPEWTNPGRTPSERAFFDRKKAEHDLRNGGSPPVPVPATHGAYHTNEINCRARMRGRQRQAPVFGDAPRAFVSRGKRRKIMDAAEAFERRTKLKGRKNGLLGATGVNVLRALLFKFHSAQGQTYPSYTALQKATGYCRQTIAECIDRLERNGFLQVINRVKRVVDQVFSSLHGCMINIIRIVQTSNAYTMHVPDALDGSRAEPAEHRPFPPRRIVNDQAPVMGWQAMAPNLQQLPESGN